MDIPINFTPPCLVTGSKSSRVNTETRRLKTNRGNGLKDFDSWEDGIRDYRSIPWRSFLTQPMLQREEKDVMSIGVSEHITEYRQRYNVDLFQLILLLLLLIGW